MTEIKNNVVVDLIDAGGLIAPGSPAWIEARRAGLERLARLRVDGDNIQAGIEARKLARTLSANVCDVIADAAKLISTQTKMKMSPFAPAGLQDFEPATMPSPLDSLMDRISDIIPLRVTMSDEAVWAATFWCVAAWGIRSLASGRPGPRIFPRLWIKSAAKRCGKTMLVDTIGLFVPRPVRADSISAAALYRVVGEWQPTLLIDEADVLLRMMPDAVQMLNMGYTRAGAAIRCTEVKRAGAKTPVPASHPAFAATVVAGIGETSSTLADRSIRIVLARRSADVAKTTFRQVHLDKIRNAFGPHLAAWGDEVAAAMDAGLSSATLAALGLASERDMDNWEPLGAVAYLAGGPWPDRWAAAAKALAGKAPEVSGPEKELSDIMRALREMRDDCAEKIRTWRGNGRQGAKPPGLPFASSFDLVSRLMAMPDSFLGHLDSEHQAKARIAKALKCYRIEPDQFRLQGGVKARGYHVRPILNVARQYLGK